MKISILSLFVFTMLAFSSCQKGDFIKDDVIKDDVIKDDVAQSGDKVDCFVLVYPVTYEMPDGTTITGNEEEIKLAMKAWYEAHPDSKVDPVLQYPVEAVFGDFIKTINNADEMDIAKKGCKTDVAVCDWTEPTTTDGAVWKKYIIKPLVTKDNCGCVVSGFVKYTKNGHTAYLLDYGDGACDKWAFLLTCYDGNCNSDKVKKCKVKLDCNPG